MIRFTVHGTPAPQGSKGAIVNRHTGKAAVVESSKRVRPWRADLREAAEQAMTEYRERADLADGAYLAGPLHVQIDFTMPRPGGHHMSGKRDRPLRATAPSWHTITPDLDKLARAVLDALSGVVWPDDAVVASLTLSKLYGAAGARSGCQVSVHEVLE